MKQEEKELIDKFQLLERHLEDLDYLIVRDEDYKYIITIPELGVVDFFTKSNKLFFRHDKSWNDFGLEFFQKIVKNYLDKLE